MIYQLRLKNIIFFNMKKDIVIHKVNETFVKIETSESILTHIFKTFRFTNKKLRYHPKVRAKLWDGYINLFDRRTNQMYIGLIGELVEFCNEYEYSYEFSFKKENNYDVSILNETKSLLEDEFKLFEHQEKAIDFAINSNRGIIISATGSGKSAIIYLLAMYYLLKNSKKVLIIVPRTQLVEQLSESFLNYHKGDKEKFSSTFELIYSGSRRNPDASIVFSTWQSIYNNSKEYFEEFDVVLFDEAHMAKSKCLISIMEKCINAKYKFGFTGTLSNENEESEIDELTLKGLFGKIQKVSSNKELIDKDILTKCEVNVMRFNYLDKDLCKTIMKGTKEIQEINDYTKRKKKIYDNELNYILSSEERNKFISNLALTRQGNVLLMFQFVEKQGKILHELLKKNAKEYNKEIYLIYGDIDTNKREEIRNIIEQKDNVILVSSYGTTSTGLDFKNVHHIIFATGFKTRITMKQTIGRGLRKHASKDILKIYDIGDDFSNGKKTKNFLFDHFIERVNIYKEEKFPIKISEYDVENKKIKLKE